MIDAIEVLVRQKNEWRDRAETAERERDEARAAIGTLRELVGCRSRNVGDVDMPTHTREIMEAVRHRADRAERVVERINGIRLSPLCCDGENNAEVDAYHDGFNAAMEEVRDAIRALDAEAQP